MESHTLKLCSKFNPFSRSNNHGGIYRYTETKLKVRAQVVPAASAFSYKKFVDFALDQTKLHTHLIPSSLQEKVSHIQAIDGKIKLNFQSFEGSNVRLLRSMHIDGGDSMQLLPWGGKLTGESLRFFSPIVIWTRFTSSQNKHDVLFDAFKDYYKAWLNLMEQAVEETSAAQIMLNREAQHKYLTWRAEKDPGHPLLKRLMGEADARHVLRSFLFNGVDELGSRTFLDYFPEYKLEDGTINEKRSIMGKSFESRPWDGRGELIAN